MSLFIIFYTRDEFYRSIPFYSTWGYKVTRGYRGLLEVTGGYKGLQEVTGRENRSTSFKRLIGQNVQGKWVNLNLTIYPRETEPFVSYPLCSNWGDTRGYRRLQGVYKGYEGLPGITRSYRSVRWGYKRLQGITMGYK